VRSGQDHADSGGGQGAHLAQVDHKGDQVTCRAAASQSRSTAPRMTKGQSRGLGPSWRRSDQTGVTRR
jgi:hypothetical protein